MPVGLFSDIGKTAKDILTKNYSYDKKLDLKSSTPSGLSFSASGSSLTGGPVAADFTLKHKVGPAVVSTKIDTNGRITGDVEFADKVAPGVKVTVKGSYPEPQVASVAAEYKADTFTATVSVDSKLVLNASAVVGYHGVIVGGVAEYDTNKGAPTKYDLGVSYSTPAYVLSGILRNKLSELAGSYVQHINSSTSLAAELVHKFADKKELFSLGVLYKLDKTAVAKVKVDSEAVVAASLSQEIRQGVSLVLSTQVNSKTLDKDSHKLGISLLIDA
eukprot:CAMPEP_0184656364 /NCGR_PEP_ID=MMETSP0308-20130426/16450_1 /TAXON_ID=38269 /ORGANISM="Gloeochaete witrockiana, Strain SAG 46.84" /LENGTH=273 /DNA_ID=CAMNT_0027093461 /DNA_START=71 /DNA_END=892 /DNA_ORIENTATION=+